MTDVINNITKYALTVNGSCKKKLAKMMQTLVRKRALFLLKIEFLKS